MLNGAIKEFKVIRAKWLRGSDSELLDENGKMCCLGFVCSQLGISKEKGVPLRAGCFFAGNPRYAG